MNSPDTAAIRALSLGTAGHIDHGKTTLVHALTGIDTDRLPEEKRRGMTIDLGFAEFRVGEFHLGVVDVPGHERFVKNMLAGATGIDLALLVVAADDGVMQQTREHLAILDLLGICHGVVAISKGDTRDADWIELVVDDVQTLLKGTCLEHAPIVVTAVPAGGQSRGLKELRFALESVCRQVEVRNTGSLFRLAIDRSFTIAGRGTVVTGTVWSGAAAVGDVVEWAPLARPVTLRGLHNHGRPVETIRCGQRAAVNLSGVHHSDIVRGHELATPGYLKPSRLLTAELRVLADSPFPVKDRSHQRLHIGTQEVMTRVTLLDRRVIRPGERGIAQLDCQQEVLATCGQPLVLRLESPVVTIGGGRILQPAASRLSRARHNLLGRLTQLSSAEPIDRTEAAIFFFGIAPWTVHDICRDANIMPDESKQLLRHLCESGKIVSMGSSSCGPRLLHCDVIETLQQRLLGAVEACHAQDPLAPTIPRKRLISRFSGSGDEEVLSAVIGRLLAAGKLEGDDRVIARTGYAPRLSPRQQALMDRLLDEIRQREFQPPSTGELSGLLDAPRKDIDLLLRLCVGQGRLVHIGGELYLTANVETALREKVSCALREAGQLTVSQIKDVLGTTRKFALPICQYLDQIELTCREGDFRQLASNPKLR